MLQTIFCRVKVLILLPRDHYTVCRMHACGQRRRQGTWVLHTDGTAAAHSRVTARAEARTHRGGVVGTQIVQAQPRRGVVFLTERRLGSAQVTLAIGWV